MVLMAKFFFKLIELCLLFVTTLMGVLYVCLPFGLAWLAYTKKSIPIAIFCLIVVFIAAREIYAKRLDAKGTPITKKQLPRIWDRFGIPQLGWMDAFLMGNYCKVYKDGDPLIVFVNDREDWMMTYREFVVRFDTARERDDVFSELTSDY